jgi:hypothetical protein
MSKFEVCKSTLKRSNKLIIISMKRILYMRHILYEHILYFREPKTYIVIGGV